MAFSKFYITKISEETNTEQSKVVEELICQIATGNEMKVEYNLKLIYSFPAKFKWKKCLSLLEGMLVLK